MKGRMAASLVKEGCDYGATESVRHPGVAHMNSMATRSMASGRHGEAPGLLVTKLLRCFHWRNTVCVPEVLREQLQQSVSH